MRTRGRIYPTPGQETVTTSCCFSPSPPVKKRRTTVKLVVTSATGGGVRTIQKQQPGDAVSLASSEVAPTLNSSSAGSVAAVAAVDVPSAGCGIEKLHDDLLITILTKVSSTASSPADLINTMLT